MEEAKSKALSPWATNPSIQKSMAPLEKTWSLPNTRRSSIAMSSKTRNQLVPMNDSDLPYRWGMTADSTYTDIVNGSKDNEAMGWYESARDPRSQAKAVAELRRHGIMMQDWWAIDDEKQQGAKRIWKSVKKSFVHGR